MTIAFFIPGQPRPKGSWNLMRNSKTGQVFAKADPAHKSWQGQVSYWAQVNKPDGDVHTGPIALTMTYHLPRPKTVKRALPTTKPDLDKLERAMLDGMTGIMFEDDRQVVEVHHKKVYAIGGRIGVDVEVRRML